MSWNSLKGFDLQKDEESEFPSLLEVTKKKNKQTGSKKRKRVKRKGKFVPIQLNLFENRLKHFNYENNVSLYEAIKLFDLLTAFEKVTISPRGLINSGNQCYINAILQSLVMCSPFYQFLKSLAFSSNSTEISLPFIQCFIEFVSQFDTDSKSCNYPPLMPHCVYNLLLSIGSDSFVSERQEDAEEFLCFVLNGLHKEMMSFDPFVTENVEDTPITKIFGGKLCTSVTQPEQKISNSHEPFFSLPLTFPNHDRCWSVEDALFALTEKESFPESESNRSITRQQFIEILPPILILHLKRFVYDKNEGLKKINRRMEFRNDLIISEDLLSKTSRKYSLTQRTYKLFAVVCHHGERATGGHYTADVFHSGLSSWLRMNDQNIQNIYECEVTGHNPTRSPYILFYQKDKL